MTIGLQPTQSGDQGALAALRSFLLSVLPFGVDCVEGQDNLVPEPTAEDFVVFTPVRMSRLATNLDGFVDTRFEGSISGDTLTATFTAPDDYGALKAGSVLFAVGLANPTSVVAQISGPAGGSGTYTVSAAQSLSTRTMAAGVLDATQNLEWTVQIDVHGDKAAPDNAARIATMFRDEYATNFFRGKFPDGSVTPLHADEPKQIPFINAEKQWEDRWSIDACLQVNATVTDIPQEFFEQVVVAFIPVDIFYPASA